MFRDETDRAARRSAEAKAKTEARRRLEHRAALESDISTPGSQADHSPSNVLVHRRGNQLIPTPRITAPMPIPLDDQGLAFFINRFVTRVAIRSDESLRVGFVQPSPHIGTVILDHASREAVVSVGLSALSNVNNDRVLRLISREKHAMVLKAVRQVVENHTQTNPDRTLHLIVMLSLYEVGASSS